MAIWAYTKNTAFLRSNLQENDNLMNCKIIIMKPAFIVWLEAAVCRCSANKVFLKVLQNSQENACVVVSFY